MADKTRDRNYSVSLLLCGLRDGILGTVTFNLLSLQVCLSYVLWLWKKLQVGKGDKWDDKGRRIFDHLVHGGKSCAADQ